MAQAQTILTFDSFPVDGYEHSSYSEGDFELSSGRRGLVGVDPNDQQGNTGSVGVRDDEAGDTFVLRRQDGGSFSVESFDADNFTYPFHHSDTFSVRGEAVNGTFVSQTFATDLDLGPQHFTLNADFLNVVSFQYTLGPSVVFDNVAVGAATPVGLVRYSQGADYDAANSTDLPVTVYSGPDVSYTVVPNGSGLKISNGIETQTTSQGSGGPFSYSLDFSSNSAAVSLTGGAGGDVIRGGAGRDTLNGGAGNDKIEGGLGFNQIDGGSGINTISYEHFNDGSGKGVSIIVGEGNTDSSPTSDGTLALVDDFKNIQNFVGSAFGDEFIASIGREVFEGGAGADIYIGEDVSIASYLHSAEGVAVNLLTNVSTGGDAAGDIFYGINYVFGSTHADSLMGNGNDNSLYGQGDADSLYGMGGNDHLFVNEMPETVDGGDDVDQLQLLGGANFTFTNANFKNVEGTIVFGGQIANFSNVSTGTGIASRSLAGRANAAIIGTSGADRIKAGAAGDDMTGGGGQDTLIAGGGADTFHFNSTGFGRDLVVAVDTAMDHLDLSGIADSSADLVFRQTGNSTGLRTTITIRGNTLDAITLIHTTAEQAQTAGFITYGAAAQAQEGFAHALFNAAFVSGGQSETTIAPPVEPIASHLAASILSAPKS